MKAKVRLFARLADLAGTRETEGGLGEGVRGGEGGELALIPPVGGGGRPRPEPVQGLFEVTAGPLDSQRLIDYVRRDESGAVAVVLGVVRDNSRGRRVLYLEYDA